MNENPRVQTQCCKKSRNQTGQHDNLENICTSMQQGKGHGNMRSVNKRSTSMSEGGPALEIHVPCLGKQRPSPKKVLKRRAEISRVHIRCNEETARRKIDEQDTL